MKFTAWRGAAALCGFLIGTLGLQAATYDPTNGYVGAQTQMRPTDANVDGADPLIFNVTSGYFNNGSTKITYVNPNISLLQLSLNDGYGGGQAWFTGSLAGAGTIETTRVNGSSHDLVFTGDITGFTGAISMFADAGASDVLGDANTNIIQFGGDTAGGTVAAGTVTGTAPNRVINNVSGTGTFTMNNLVYNYTTDAAYDLLQVTNAIEVREGLYIKGNANMTMTGIISGSGFLQKDGTGTLTLNGANTYSGATNINAGTLEIGTGGSLGTGTVTIASGAKLLFTTDADVSGLAFAGGGTIEVASGVTLTGLNLTTGQATLAGAGTFNNLTLNGAAMVQTAVVNLSGTATFTAGSIDLSAIVNNTGDFNIFTSNDTDGAGIATALTGFKDSFILGSYMADTITYASPNIVLSATPAAPIAEDQNVTLTFGNPTVDITLTTEFGQDTFAIATNPTNGALSAFDENAGTVTYTPNANFAGNDTFTFTATNGNGTSAPATVTVLVQGIYYVNGTVDTDPNDGDDANDGLTWATAKATISAAASATGAAAVYVKGETYNYSSTLSIPTGVTVYGGFAGTETAASERAKTDVDADGQVGLWEFTNETLIQADGFTSGRVIAVAASAGIDGLTVTGGGKGGVEFTGNNGVIRNCQVSGNTLVSANSAGAGGIYTNKVTGFLIDGCLVKDNTVTGTDGDYSADCAGGIAARTFQGGGSGGTISNTMVINNTATKGPGGIFTGRTNSTTIINCLVANNTGASGAGNEAAMAAGIAAHSGGGAQCTIINTTVVNNQSLGTTTAGGVCYAKVKNSVIWGNADGDSPAQILSLNENTNNAIQDDEGTPTINLDANNTAATGPNFVSPSTTIGVMGTYSGDWQLTQVSPLLEAGTNGENTQTGDVLGLDRKRSAITAAGQGLIDLGAYEYVFMAAPTPTITSTNNFTIDFNWNAVTGAAPTQGYVYQVASNPEFSADLQTATVDTTSASVSVVAQGTYYVRVRAQNAATTGITEWSAAADDTVSPVLGLTIEVIDNTLFWRADREIGVVSYQVEQFIHGQWQLVEAFAAGESQYQATIDSAYDVRLVVIDQSGFVQSFLPDLNGKARTAYTLTEGWNLLSMPLADADLSTLYQSIDSPIYVWDGANYVITETLVPGQGFFVYSATSTDVIVAGTAIDFQPTLVSGWNLVGFAENSEKPAAAQIIYTGSTYQEVLNQDVLVAGAGYWIFVD